MDPLGSDLGAPAMEQEVWRDEVSDLEVEGTVGRAAAPAPRKAKDKAWSDLSEAPVSLDEATLLSEPEAEASPEEGETVRQWFPESFLWQPLVETGPEGVAQVEVRVPDQLTTWRVLALAHDRRGQQAGSVALFDSTLPLYVDPVVPGWLYAGDEVVLPVQVVNTTAEPAGGSLRVATSGALTGGGQSVVHLDAYGTALRELRLSATGAGEAQVEAALEGTDRVTRTILVSPVGRPVRQTRGGLLSKERSLTLTGPAGADPRTQRLTVAVFPGPLAVLHSEVERVGAGGATAPGYGFAVASAARALGERLGAEVDPVALRALELRSWQRVVRLARSPDAGVASDLLLATEAVEDNELVESLRARLTQVVVAGQRADGTWSRAERASLQQVVVQTAWAARSLPESEAGARARASGALERYAREVDDPYTAAMVLSTGLISEAQAERLRALVQEAVVEDAEGARELSVPAGVLNPWGYRPTLAEGRALAWLALRGAEVEWSGDLVAGLMGSYDAELGFGAGPADALALEVVQGALPGLEGEVEVVLEVDGVERSRARLDAQQPKLPAVLIAPGSGAVHLSVSPPVPGLAFVATLDSWVPWSGREGLPGVEVEVSSSPWRVGREGELLLTVSAPSGLGVRVEQGLPAGAVVDEVALAGQPGLEEVVVHSDRVSFTTRPFSAGEVMEIPIRVTPAFAGSFSTVPLRVGTTEPGGAEVQLAPAQWRVAPG